MTVRLDKYLANLGYASRRKIESFLQANRVEINGQQVLASGERFDPDQDTLTINGKELQAEKKVYYIVHKPEGFVSSVVAEAEHPSVVDLLKKVRVRVYPVGRLDVDTSGLLLLTNDGELTYQLTHPKFHVPKTYKAIIKGNLIHKHLTMLRTGIRLKDGKTAPAQVKIDSKSETSTRLLITLHEGRNRQIRRMCKAINLHLINLQRINFAGIELGNLKPREYRELTTVEVEELKALTQTI